jgi:hypothetical protein
MHASEIRPILGTRHQPGAHRILANILPLLRVAFVVSQAMMKPAGLKRSRVQVRFGEPVFPETYPAFNGEFQVARRTEQMQVIGHQQIIAHLPCRGRVLPDVVQRALRRGLRQPALAFLRADGEETQFGLLSET